MSKSIEGLESFVSLNRFYEAAQADKPTLQEVESAVLVVCRFYGAENEETILNSSNSVLIETYKEIKAMLYSTLQ